MDRVRDAFGGDEDESRLPDHEYKDPNTLGGGVMSSGGTAVERGTTQIDPSGEDDRSEPGEIETDRDASDAYQGVATPGDLFGGRAENTGRDDDEALDEDQGPQPFNTQRV